ncbi:DUF2088 domain-containing protein [Nocardioides sp. LHG3406-4]|uniref:DUF2088 domain-containing protein n=1 Tax=Nocardioides sp. LHG3406-4 TaxID=2804575 RepID=UPI003CEE0C5A
MGTSGAVTGPVLAESAALCARMAPWRRVSTQFPRLGLADPAGTLRERLRAHHFEGTEGAGGIWPGATVAIAVGSRGISGLPGLVRAVADFVRERGASPVVVPAMGSHGGGTPAGQLEVLAALGVSEASMGCPVRADAGTELVGTVEGIDVHLSRYVVREVDAVIPVARVKPHTDFRGRVESGVLKMLAVGLGQHAGADSLHRVPPAEFSAAVEAVGTFVLGAVAVPLSVAVVEDAYDQVAMVEVLGPGELLEREVELLVEARSLMPRLPFAEADILIVQELGKNISGTGMDPNITGRYYRPTPSDASVGRVVTLELTHETHGNACGVGMADIVTRRLADGIDWRSTYTNEVAARMLEGARLPLVAEDDEDAIGIALHSLGKRDPEAARIAWIRNTLAAAELWVSEPLWNELDDRDRLVTRGEPTPPSFVNGRLVLPSEDELGRRS